MFFTPILLITFNRPNYVCQVLTEIRKLQPTQLFICQDGAREGNALDQECVQQVRDVINELVDWPCELHMLYQEKNLGCGPGPAAGISWFFSQVDMGIVLEDDCIPHLDFFSYCDELLKKYQYDSRISFIGGCNYQLPVPLEESYSFMGGHHQTWGWATWRRTWENFDYNLTRWNEKQFKNVIKRYYKDYRQRAYWMNIYNQVKKNRMNDSCWDYQFYFSCWEKGQLAICPNVNLVSNVGFGHDATHTNGENNALLSVQTKAILPLKHPKEVICNQKLDDFMMKTYIIPYEYEWEGIKRLPYRINAFIKKVLHHQGPWIKKK